MESLESWHLVRHCLIKLQKRLEANVARSASEAASWPVRGQEASMCFLFEKALSAKGKASSHKLPQAQHASDAALGAQAHGVLLCHGLVLSELAYRTSLGLLELASR